MCGPFFLLPLPRSLSVWALLFAGSRGKAKLLVGELEMQHCYIITNNMWLLSEGQRAVRETEAILEDCWHFLPGGIESALLLEHQAATRSSSGDFNQLAGILRT